MDINKVFFKNVVVSSDNSLSTVDAIIKANDLKYFKVECVADDCEDYIKELLSKEVVLDPSSRMRKIKEVDKKNYYLVHQSDILFY